MLLASTVLAGAGVGDIALVQAPDVTIPETIRVRITGEGYCTDGTFSHVEVMDFKEYVVQVLAGEWGNRWSLNSLRAGAVAIKMYGMNAIAEDPKWEASAWAQDRVADVYDCHWDQAMRADWVNDKVRRAVDDTWDYLLLTEDTNEIFYTYYNARHFYCIARGAEGQCMGQWESYDLAKKGTDWRNILLSFYEDSAVVSVDGEYYQDSYQVVLDGQYIEGESNGYVIQLGDTLISIARDFYGTESTDVASWMKIYNANADMLYSPNHIVAGHTLLIPDTQ